MTLLFKIELLLNGPIKRRYCYLKKKVTLLLKIEDGTVTKWTNQKAALLLKIESDTVTKNNGPIRRDLEESQVYKKE